MQLFIEESENQVPPSELCCADPTVLAKLVSRERVPADGAGCAALSTAIMDAYANTKGEASNGHDALINYLMCLEDDVKQYGVHSFECEVRAAMECLPTDRCR
jgi:hypothetical protein